MIKDTQKKPNNLIEEKSPYLLQHAYNPVNWYAWGDEAFEAAKTQDKPIFLSIGYSTCHWCHVMAHESFEDPEIAQLINETFIPIKVDREERPDVDKIYMFACQVMSGRGGWPLTIMMTPDKKPFFAGTYIPKEGRFGQLGLLELIPKVNDMWENERDKLFQASEQVTYAIQNALDESPGEKLDKETLREAYAQLSKRFDAERGGFGMAPKFPSPHNYYFLLRYWKRTGDENALKMVEKTLQEMRKGGIYDHIGFGFHRYSTDSKWFLPHFEKMLYDQALLAIAYLELYQATNKDFYAQVAREIFTYVLRDMTSQEGGFYSAEDADSEGVEGKFYVWSKQEIEDILGKGERNTELFIESYNITNSGNYKEEASKQRTGKNILYLTKSFEELASDYKLNPSRLKEKLEEARKKLFSYREKRIHPHKDDKILTDWNGLMIAALAQGARILGDEELHKASEKAINFMRTHLRQPNGKLLHRFRGGKAGINAYVDDYSFMIWGLIEMYQTIFDTKYLKLALDLNDILLSEFWDENIGGFYFTSDEGEKLIIRQKEIYDGAIPSGNSVAMMNLLKLSYFTGNLKFERKAEIISRVFSEKIKSNPSAFTMLMSAVDFGIGPSYKLVIAGDSNAEDTTAMIKEIAKNFFPNIVIIQRPMELESPEIDEIAEFFKLYNERDKKATAYACFNQGCKPATTSKTQMLEYLDSKW
jgi:hypothetical protein